MIRQHKLVLMIGVPIYIGLAILYLVRSLIPGWIVLLSLSSLWIIMFIGMFLPMYREFKQFWKDADELEKRRKLRFDAEERKKEEEKMRKLRTNKEEKMTDSQVLDKAVELITKILDDLSEKNEAMMKMAIRIESLEKKIADIENSTGGH